VAPSGSPAAAEPDSLAGEVSALVGDSTEPTAPVPIIERDPTAQIPIRGPIAGTLERASELDRRPIIAIENLWKTYHPGDLAIHALRGVTFRINEGEFVAFMGPSGSGKSTLMHIMGCLDNPTSGTYLLDGQDVSGMSEFQLARIRNRRIGFVFQGYHLLPRLSACRNVELPLVYAGVSPEQRRQRALAELTKVGLAERVQHRPTELSGGQQQRVAIARALVTNPAVVLADEPTGNLDSHAAVEILDLLSSLHHAGRTVVLITHDADVAGVAERVMQVRDGQIASDSAAA
jgi:putative ABC transport system ATP-binding protein